MSLFKQILIGLKHNYSAQLELVGVGYKVSLHARILHLSIGFSHILLVAVPDSLELEIKKTKTIICKSSNYQNLTQFIASLRHLKLPDVYKGKGLRLKNETVAVKEGKKKK